MRALLRTDIYGIIPSVMMLLDFGMVGLAVLVIIFSIVFPFAKQAVLWTAWRSPETRPVLGWLVGSAGQTLVATEPLAGVPSFLGGVLCTMTAGGLLARRWSVEPPPPNASMP